MFHYSHFNRNILNPIQRLVRRLDRPVFCLSGCLMVVFLLDSSLYRAGYIGEGRKAMLLLKNDILDPVLLRRTKDTR